MPPGRVTHRRGPYHPREASGSDTAPRRQDRARAPHDRISRRRLRLRDGRHASRAPPGNRIVDLASVFAQARDGIRAQAAAFASPRSRRCSTTGTSRFTGRLSPPWVLKPRSSAAAIGINKVENRDGCGSRSTGGMTVERPPRSVRAGDVYPSTRSCGTCGRLRRGVQYGRPPWGFAQVGLFLTRRLPTIRTKDDRCWS